MKIRYTSLQDIKVGDELYIRHTILGGSLNGTKVVKVSKTLITDSNGSRWRISDGRPSGYVYSRMTMATNTAYKFLGKVE